MPSFADALNRSMETIKRPPPPPIGKYIARVTQVPTDASQMTSQRDGTTYTKLTIPIGLVSPLEDVSPDDLAAYGSITSTTVRLDFIFNEQDNTKFEGTLDRLKNFIAMCGVTFGEGETLKEVLPRLANAQMIVELSHRLDNRDNETVYAEIAKTYPLA